MLIKINQDKTLTITKSTSIYEQENNVDILHFIIDKNFSLDDKGTNITDCSIIAMLIGEEIIPKQINSCTPFIDLVELEKVEDYNENYYQYQFKITDKYTFAQIHYSIYLTIINGLNQIVMKTETACFDVQKRETIEDYYSEDRLSILDQWLVKMEKMAAEGAATKEYIDSKIQFNDYHSFPAIGEEGSLYIDTTANKTYRWDNENLKYVCCGADIETIQVIDGSF